MTRLFISLPMRGKTDEQIAAERKEAAAYVERYLGEKVVVIDSYFKGANCPGLYPLFLLGKAIELLATADVVYFAKDWDKARGCRIEHTCAVEYGIKIIEESTEK